MRPETPLLATLLALACTVAIAKDTVPNWTVRTLDGTCALESVAQPVNDGYLDITVQLRFSRSGLRALTPSTIDVEGGHLGLLVDAEPLPLKATVDDETDVVFDGDMAMIGEHFVRGGTAQLRLRFWPTWPVTGTKPIDYSLKGFTLAWKQYQQCL